MPIELTADQQLAATLLLIIQAAVIGITYRTGYLKAWKTQRATGYEAACAELLPKLKSEQRARAEAEMLLSAARSQLRSRSDLQRTTQILSSPEGRHA